ncbi:glycosyl hydrolase [Brachybacterium sp. P6-10-X1]|uniref:glycosyltransferase family 2 protein n=1 Tax=Brachybacterium sp. P6-10-X1 TaxID=1903186 RepID=UPI000971B37A|nr:glycosyltransferase [Brachybacterium sp. P6-10-X1]APX34160.1 glycosyl hydrolase [Brachybacterium sp. P6-10-X1]
MSAAGPLTAHRPERVAVVIPAKNEAERIEATIGAAHAITGVDLVVVVDDGSSDATSAVAMGADALVVRHRSNRGKAAAMATGAQMIALREGAERAEGGEGFSEELHAEPRTPGHTGPLPVIDGDTPPPRALLFLDADMEGSATAAQPLVDAVLGQGVDMAIALLPPQVGAGGMGVVVRTARRGIERATGWTATQPLSGTRCITRETWDACQPLAPGWGVETSLTIDALTGGFWVKEIEAELHHRATGSDLRGRLHRAAQLRDVVRALARKRQVVPEEPADEDDTGLASADLPDPAGQGEPTDAADLPDSADVTDAADSADPALSSPGPLGVGAAAGSPATGEPEVDGLRPSQVARTWPGRSDAPAAADDQVSAAGSDVDEAHVWSVVPEVSESGGSDDAGFDDAAADHGAAEEAAAALRADRRRERLAILPVDGAFSDDETRAIGDRDIELLDRRLRALPVDGTFAPDDVVYLVDIDLDALAVRLQEAPVEEPFEPGHAVIIASHLTVPEPELPSSIRPPLSADEYTSLVVHAAVDAGNTSADDA